MAADESLLLLLQDVRGKTLRLLQDVNDELAFFRAPGLANHILWHAGHSLVIVEHLALSAATGDPPSYPDGWFEKFGWKSTPATVKDWPPLAQVIELLKAQQERLAAAIRNRTDAQLAAPVGDASKGRTLRWGIIHGLLDEAGHGGEIWMLKKIYAKQHAAP